MLTGAGQTVLLTGIEVEKGPPSREGHSDKEYKVDQTGSPKRKGFEREEALDFVLRKKGNQRQC